MLKKWKLPFMVLALAALMFSGCERIQITSGDSDSVKPQSGAEDSPKPTPDPQATPGGDETQTPEPIHNDEWLPYAEQQGQALVYGYMDAEGNVVIQPEFSQAEPFYACGAAVVADKEGNYGLIDKSGSYIIDPAPGYLSYAEGIFQRYNDETTYGYDEKGIELFKVGGYLSNFSDGLAVLYGDTEDGYIDTTGSMVLQVPLADNLGNFVDGMARIATDYSGPPWFIDKDGNDLTDTVSSGLRAWQEGEDGLMYYIDKDGNALTDDRFSEVEPFRDGLAIVNASEDFSQPSYGIINAKGEYVLKPIYTGIQRMRNGSFTVGEAYMGDSFVPSEFFWYSKKAVFSNDLKSNTGWIFTSVEDYDKDFVCVNDGKKVYYIDSDLNKAKDLPEFEGVGSMLADGDQFRGTLNECLTIADKDGNILLRDKKLTRYGDGVYTENVTEYPDIHSDVSYPVIKGMKDKAMQDKLNGIVKDDAMASWESGLGDEPDEDPYSFPVTHVSSSLKITKDLLQIDTGTDFYWMGAAHGSYYWGMHFVNIKNGNTYTLADLFKNPDEALKYISGRITGEIKVNIENEDNMYLVDEVTPDQITNFYLSDEGVNVYFAEYEVAAYAAGMPEFLIPYSDLTDYINYDGEFWKSFN